MSTTSSCAADMADRIESDLRDLERLDGIPFQMVQAIQVPLEEAIIGLRNVAQAHPLILAMHSKNGNGQRSSDC